MTLAPERPRARRRAAAEPLRFVALGDSITVGLGDGVSMGQRATAGGATGRNAGRGWAAVLAPCLGAPGQPAAAYTNLATTGARVRDVLTDQLPVALAERPHVAAVLAGMNDVIRGAFDAGQVRADLVTVVSSLREAGALVLVVRVHDPGVRFRLPRRLRQALLARIGTLNSVVDGLGAADDGVLVLDLPGHPECYHRSTWDVDRVHPGARGHRLLARGFADLLRERGVPVRRLPDLGPTGGGPGTVAHLWWLASRGLPWLLLKSSGVWSGVGALVRGAQTGPGGDTPTPPLVSAP